MTTPGAALKLALTLALLAIAPAAISAATLSDVSSHRDGSHSFQRSELQLVSVEGSGYYSFHLYSRFSQVSDVMRDRRGSLDAGLRLRDWTTLEPRPIVVDLPTLTDPPVVAEPPVFSEPPAFSDPPTLTDDPPAAAEPPTLLLIGTGLLAATSARKRRQR